jgi:hypothetical protein
MASPMLKIIPGPRMLFADYALLRVGSHYCREHTHAENHKFFPIGAGISNTSCAWCFRSDGLLSDMPVVLLTA